MLLVSEEPHGSVGSSAVGGGSASPAMAGRSPAAGMGGAAGGAKATQEPRPPSSLQPGESEESFRLLPRSRTERCYLLDGDECLAWDCFVADGYTIDFTAKVRCGRARSEVKCRGRRVGLVGVDSSRVLAETQRRGAFRGHIDLGGEDKDCAAGAHEGLVLTLEISNSFSIFAAKDVTLRMTKLRPGGGVPLSPRRAPEPPPEDVPGDRRLPGPAHAHRPLAASPPPSPGRLLVGDAAGGTGGSRCDQAAEDDRSAQLRGLLAEAVRICPAGASKLRGHLRSAQACLAEIATADAAEDLGSPLG